MFTRILVATDFSEASDAALDYARAVASRFGGCLHLIHVIEDAVTTGVFGVDAYSPLPPGAVARLRADGEAALAVRLSEFRGFGISGTSEIVTGPVAATIVDTAVARGVDLIVMGTHGRTGLAHALMGSVAERVVRTAECPVLTVHGRSPQFAHAECNWSAATVPA